MKKYLINLVFVLWSAAVPAAGNNPLGDFILTSDIIKIIDGFSLGINDLSVLKFMHIRHEMMKMIYGIENKDKVLVGIYEFDDQKRSIDSLIEVENQLSTHSNSFTSVQQHQWDQLHDILAQAKEEFLIKTKPMLADAQGAKQPMLVLMTEWATKANRENSYLLSWGATKEGEETKYFDGQVTSLAKFKEFCHDLIHFLETLIKSCPKACKQFEEFKRKQKEQRQKKTT